MVGTPRCGVHSARWTPPLLPLYRPTMSLVPRRTLPHNVPLWIDPTKEIYFITVSCLQRGQNQLAISEIADQLIETVAYRNERSIWSVRLMLIMPDHVHFLVSFPDSGKTIPTIMSKWKEWAAKHLAIQWQRDFFEHRLRRDESARDKADYILLNPVRAGLVAKPEDWAFVFIPDQ